MQLKGKLFVTFLAPLLLVGCIGLIGHYVSNHTFRQKLLSDDVKIGSVLEMEVRARGISESLLAYVSHQKKSDLKLYKNEMDAFDRYLGVYSAQELNDSEEADLRKLERKNKQMKKLGASIIEAQMRQSMAMFQLKTIGSQLVAMLEKKWQPTLSDDSADAQNKKQYTNAVKVSVYALVAVMQDYMNYPGEFLKAQIKGIQTDLLDQFSELKALQLSDGERRWLNQVDHYIKQSNVFVLKIKTTERNELALLSTHYQDSLDMHYLLNEKIQVIAKKDKLKTKAYIDKFYYLLVLTVLCVIVFSMLIAWWLATRFILSPVTKMQSAIDAMVKGDAVGDLQIDNQDELGALADSLKHLSSNNEVWSKSQVLHIARSTQGVRNLPRLMSIVTAELSKVLEVVYAAFYYSEQMHDKSTPPCLRLQTVSPNSAFDSLPQLVGLNEGVAGLCLANKEMVDIVDIPDAYRAVALSLGQTFPAQVIALPVLSGGDIFGVFEFVSPQVLTKLQKTTLIEAVSNLGHLVRNIQIRSPTSG